MTEPHRFSDWDAAYVLGALSVPERHAYEDHLSGCADCRAAVAELAAMPGLLGQLTPEEARALNEDQRLAETEESVPADGTPPESIRTMTPPGRSWPMKLIMVGVIVLALILGAVAGYLVRGAVQPPAAVEPSAAAPSAFRVAFVPVGSSPMIAIADLARDGAQTVIDVECQYPPPSSGYPGGGGGGAPTTTRYTLFLVDSYGNRLRGPSWSAAAGERVTKQLRADVQLSKISALEIVYTDSGDVAVRAKI